MKNYLIILTLTQLFLNSVWATAHTDNDQHNAPHRHLDSHIDSHFAVSISVEDGSNADAQSDDHYIDIHCHVHIAAFILSTENTFFKHNLIKHKLEYEAFLSSLIHTPPVPPPLT